ncbi:hypothetical protein [Paenibacillus gansuensis]|uniref:Uncharacterized protein n=1 Tax=Paenibacillus gansuensis TaxID=306542 RepID=A0ABW5PF96_9BACL
MLTTNLNFTAKGIYEAEVSTLVKADHRKLALIRAKELLAAHHWNQAEVGFTDMQERRHLLMVNQVDFMEWERAVQTEEASIYRVYGRMKLQVFTPVATGYHETYLNQSSLRLPRTLLSDKPVFIIETLSRPVFVQVEEDRLTWKSGLRSVSSIHA